MLNVVFCGTPDFAVPSLEALNQHPSVNLKAVITMPNRPAGRGQKEVSPPVATYSIQEKIKLFQTSNLNKDDDISTFFENEKIDLIVVLAFAQFLNQKTLDVPKIGCFNIHSSLLPKYRGAAPIQHALLNGDTTTGVSIQKMVKKMDAGDLVYSQEISISPDETGGQLYTRLKFLAALGMNDLLIDILNDSLVYSPQDEAAISIAPTLSKKDGLIDFASNTYQDIHNQVRGLHPWPGTFCYLNKKRLKVFKIEKALEKVTPGETFTVNNSLIVGAKDTAIRLLEIQLEGKKRCSDIELLNGFKNNSSTIIISSEV